MSSGDSLEVETSVNSFASLKSVTVPKTIADRCNLLGGGSQEVETSVNSFGIGNPGSLRGCQRQSQTGAMYAGGSLEVETSLKSFGTVDPGSLRGCQSQSKTDAMYRGGSKLVCEDAKDSSKSYILNQIKQRVTIRTAHEYRKAKRRNDMARWLKFI